jgi:hypothetical protein
MRPGRYPEDHPLEQQARDELREKTGEKWDRSASMSPKEQLRDPSTGALVNVVLREAERP